MAHKEQQLFFKYVKDKFPLKFKDCDVLDIGSLDINGNNRFLFENYNYTGVDIGPGRNVDVVSKGHEYKSDKLFDIVISSECFEHDMFYNKTIENCISLTKPNGMFIFSCASTGRPEHGTKRTSPRNSPLTQKIQGWQNYYKNLTENDIRNIIDVENIFYDFEFKYNPSPGDLYFWGIKK